MARAGLGWSVGQLAERAGVHRLTITRFESGAPIMEDNLKKILRALVSGGAAIVTAGRQAGAVSIPQASHCTPP
ncbi:helix-turn-helix domain-containing protein [Novosphingobium cyanobacteriorum]|uniref:helix-turn-helix domain-containing protein n=1 Tax=Novosphingobium cyanobacteriorum TaxID=3024215 RepID=UPI0034D96767